MRKLPLHFVLLGLVLWTGPVQAQAPGAAAKKATRGAPKAAAEPSAGASADWPNWRGPNQDRHSPETGLVDTFKPKGGASSNVLWQSEELGGISTPIILGGKLYTIVKADEGTPHEGEKVVCVNAATGEKIWENRYNIYLTDVPSERLGWSSCIGDPETGRIFAQSASGYFQCLDGETGKTVWSRSLHEEFGLVSTYGGRTNFPIVFEDLVIVNAVTVGWGDLGRPAHRFLAMDKDTGAMVWFNGTKPSPEDTTYSTPTIAMLGGQAALVFGSGDGAVWAFQPRTGKAIWNFQFSRRGLNVPPLVVGETIYMSHAEANFGNTTMGGVAAFKGVGSGDITKTNQIWRQPGIMAGKSAPLLVGDRLYVADDGAKLYIFDAATGKPVGKPIRLLGTIMRGSPLYADGKIYIASTSGFHVLKPTAEGAEFITKMRLPGTDEATASPIAWQGKLYLPTYGRMYCLGTGEAASAEETSSRRSTDNTLALAQAPAKAEPAPPASAKGAVPQPAADDNAPAHVQVLPCETLMRPSQNQKFTVRLFNAKGEPIADQQASVTFSLEGSGKISAEGVFTPEQSDKHVVAFVTAKVGDLTGVARVRVVPPLPWRFDFNDIPLTMAPPAVKPGATTGAPSSPAAAPAPSAPAPAAAGPKQPEGEAPITWVGARHRHKIRDVDGEQVMVKVTTIPKGTRSQSWMGHTDLHDYTVQADLQGQTANNLVPDMGVITQRYTLDMMGASQQLQIRSWPPAVDTAFSKTIPFAWKPQVWYTLKFSATTDDGKVALRGKVWPRESPEPKEWTIEAVDEVPNLRGSPGLFGNATNAEIFIDNVMVTSNDDAAAKVSTTAASSPER